MARRRQRNGTMETKKWQAVNSYRRVLWKKKERPILSLLYNLEHTLVGVAVSVHASNTDLGCECEFQSTSFLRPLAGLIEERCMKVHVKTSELKCLTMKISFRVKNFVKNFLDPGISHMSVPNCGDRGTSRHTCLRCFRAKFFGDFGKENTCSGKKCLLRGSEGKITE